MAEGGEDKDKFSQLESEQKVRKMTPLDSAAAFHYLMRSIHSLPVDRRGPETTLSSLRTALSEVDPTDSQE